MTEYDELFAQWRANQPERADWYQVLQSKAWKTVSRLAEASAVATAEAVNDTMPDTLLARRLYMQMGARMALRFLKHACDQEEKDEKEPEPFSQYDEKYLDRKRDNQPQQPTE